MIFTGYQHPNYAASLAEFGQPRELPRSGGWLLVREIPGTSFRDAMGCYPLFSCLDWGGLEADLEELGDELVCVSAVLDPFGDYDVALLRRCFPDVLFSFKEHFVVELDRSWEARISSHHRRNAKRARQQLSVERCREPSYYLDDWTRLYSCLVARHGIQGISAFSRASFACQLNTPGLEMFRAKDETGTVGMILWFRQGEVAYYHLGASNDQGYERRAFFALFWEALGYFAGEGLKWLDLGASPGVKANPNDGLSRFKNGWATGTRPVYFAGRILRPKLYLELAGATENSDYFPAYRRGEFG